MSWAHWIRAILILILVLIALILVRRDATSGEYAIEVEQKSSAPRDPLDARIAAMVLRSKR